MTVDSTGKYYTAVFPGGITIAKGNSVDAYVQGDITGANASGRTVEFDIYRATDIYIVGQTYGYGITPTASVSGTFTSSGNNTTAGFRASTANPFYFGSYVSVTGGTLSTVSSASTIAPQNIAVNVSGQVLGGFQTNFTGEPVTVSSLTVSVATSSTNTDQLKNVTLVDSNGNVVAGPVDETLSSKTIVFNSSITFPVGSVTYTIKGTVGSNALNGGTYTLSTNPNSQWSSAIGQTSGTYITLPNTTVTMSTMTVQSGQLNISAASAPASTNVVQNQNSYTIANIVLDASQSGEDVRLSSLPIVVSATGTVTTTSSNSFSLNSNLTGCQLFNGTTALNSQSIGSSNWAAKTNLANSGGELSVDGVEANFSFTNPLTVPKGTTVTLALECNIGGAFFTGEQFSAGVDTSYAPTVTGATSGNTINPTITSGTSGTMTIGTASMSASAPTPISYSQIAAGTQNVTVGTFTLQPTTGSVSLQNIGLALNSSYASTSDITSGLMTIWNGSTQVGTVNFSGKSITNSHYYIATSTISNFNLPQNVQTTFTIKTNIASIGTGQPGTSGHEIRVGLAEAQGTSGNSNVDTGFTTTLVPSTGIAMFASNPTMALSSLPSTGVADGRLIAFSVTANNSAPVGIGKFTFTITPGTNVTVTNPTLYAYTDSGFSSPAGGTNNGVVSSIDLGPASGATSTKMTSPIEVSMGSTLYFLLKATSVTYSGSNATWNVTTALNGDSSDIAPTMSTLTGLAASNFVWSPNSTTTSGLNTNVDWTNGYGVSGLPTFGISQTRSN